MSSRSRRKTFKPSFDVLEKRCAPAVRLVTSVADTADNGVVGELRSEIDAAATGDTIRIEIPRVEDPIIELVRGNIQTGKNLTIIGVARAGREEVSPV